DQSGCTLPVVTSPVGQPTVVVATPSRHKLANKRSYNSLTSTIRRESGMVRDVVLFSTNTEERSPT
ncbi:MAG: hypothetical protein ACYDAG_16540, partial [Chloroflexota bacterium]